MDFDLYQNITLGEPVSLFHPDMFQLAIEIDYLSEMFDRSVPHDMKDGVAMPRPGYVTMCAAYYHRLKERAHNIAKALRLDLNEFIPCLKEIRNYNHEKVTELYNKYDNHFFNREEHAKHEEENSRNIKR